MSKRIANLIDQPEQLVTKLIAQLEDKNGYPSHDARHIAETVQKVRGKISDLGLDPDDTIGEELYHSLLVKFRNDSATFDMYFDLRSANFDRKNFKLAELAQEAFELPQIWALKTSIAKKILLQHPPKRVMKHLHYRSTASLLKRENIFEVILAANHMESKAWQKVYAKLIDKLDQTAFEIRQLKVQPLDYRKWNSIEPPAGFIATDDHLAAGGIWPADQLKDATLLTLLLLLTENLNSYNHFKVSDSLSKLSYVLSWWTDMDHLIAELSDEQVSMSLHDNAINSLMNHRYSSRMIKHARTSFWQELLNRYDKLPEVEAVFDSSLREKLPQLKLPAPQPVYEYEYAEDVE